MTNMERRTDGHRQRVLKTGLISPDDHYTSMQCLIRDVSQHGARLRVESPIGIPERFDLYIVAEAFMRPASVKWTHGNQIGIEFFERRVNRTSDTPARFRERRVGGPFSSATSTRLH